MKIILGANKACLQEKEHIQKLLQQQGFEVVDVSDTNCNDFVQVSKQVAQQVQKKPSELKGIIIDEYGAGPFMVADKMKYIICAELNDEHSAKMTRQHNNANVITLGVQVIGLQVAENIVQRFVHAEYDGGRHQIRIDMLNKMC